MKRILATVLALVFTGAGLSTAAAQPPNDYLIVPDTRVGPVSLGMTDRDLFKVGVPIHTGAFSNMTMYLYADMDVFVDSASHRVISVTVKYNNQYHTAEGVRIGSNLQNVEAAMGPPEFLQTSPVECCDPIAVTYRSRRLRFSFSPPGSSAADRPKQTVQIIQIQTPGAQTF